MKHTYSETIEVVNQIIKGHREDETCLGNEYAATCGNLMSILGMVIDGSLTPNQAFESLQANAKRLSK